ncbi:hypothetical protein AH06_211 [Erwinia phage AH06]|nr:hypothetical protein AH06_211 [Erwinia phage AH06]
MPCSGIGIGRNWELTKTREQKRRQKSLDAWRRLLTQSRK